MTTPDWRKVKDICEKGVERSTNICLNPDEEEKLRLIAASEARVYQEILDLQRPKNLGQFQGEPA